MALTKVVALVITPFSPRPVVVIGVELSQQWGLDLLEVKSESVKNSHAVFQCRSDSESGAVMENLKIIA